MRPPATPSRPIPDLSTAEKRAALDRASFGVLSADTQRDLGNAQRVEAIKQKLPRAGSRAEQRVGLGE